MHPLDKSLAQVRALSPYFQIQLSHTPSGVTIGQLCQIDGAAWGQLQAVQQRELGNVSHNMLVGAVVQSYTWPVLSGPIVCYLLTNRVPVLSAEMTSVRIRNDYPELLEVHSTRFFCLATDLAAQHPDAIVVADRAALRHELRQQITHHFAPLIDALCDATGIAAKSLWVRVADASAGVVVRALDMVGGIAPEAIQEEAQALVGDADALLYCRRVDTTVITHQSCDRVFHDRVSCCYWYKRPSGGLCMTCPQRSRKERVTALTAYVCGHEEA